MAKAKIYKIDDTAKKDYKRSLKKAKAYSKVADDLENMDFDTKLDVMYRSGILSYDEFLMIRKYRLIDTCEKAEFDSIEEADEECSCDCECDECDGCDDCKLLQKSCDCESCDCDNEDEDSATDLVDNISESQNTTFSFMMYGYTWEIIMNGKAHYCGNTELEKVPITVNCRNVHTGEIVTASCACFKSNDIFHSECMPDSVAVYNVIINRIPAPDAYGDVVIRNGQNSYHIPCAHLYLNHVTIASVIHLLAIDAYMRVNHINYETAISSHISPITKLVMKITEVIGHCNEWADNMRGYMRNAGITIES